MSTELSSFQDRFAEALWAPPDAVPDHLRDLTDQPGFAVYRNTVVRGCIDALQANYPTVLRLVGEDWFRAAAALHARAQPPVDTRLLVYGADFSGFLARFAGAADLPYLAGVARLDRFWTEAHVAVDAPVLAPSALADVPPEGLGELVLQPHSAARWAWFDDQPIYTLWQRNRQDAPQDMDSDDALDWIGEGALLTRPDGGVVWTALDAGGCAFLDACAAGRPLALAADEALARQADCDLAQMMTALLQAGAFCSAQTFLTPNHQEPT